MTIAIYTYSNPYKIDKEVYWASIKNCFHLCVSQTLVNGLCDQYHEFFKGKLTTMARFINELYENWESDTLTITQKATIDNIIDSMDFQNCVSGEIKEEKIWSSLKLNRSHVYESIRIMFELGMNPAEIKEKELTHEQKCVVAIYKELKRTDNDAFRLKEDISEDDINKAIMASINGAISANRKGDIDSIRTDSVIIHGIHQFSPIMLKAIEVLSRYKLVVILFNYQPDYKNVYQTWLDVYSSFESKTVISTKNLVNDTQEFEGGRLADNLSALIGGNTAVIDFNQQATITEFDNVTEFAGYVAKLFEQAEKKRQEDSYAHPALYYMDEQFYAANSDANNILKIYFPEQFGEREFLDYPIGHFFLSITNMWDPETHALRINDLQDLYECLSCGIITEKTHGELVTIFDKAKLYFSNETTIDGINKKLKRLKNKIDEIKDDDQDWNESKKIEYFNLSKDEIDILMKALKDLNEITKYFYDDFNDQKNDFKTFYRKIGEVLKTHVLEAQDIDEEFKDIVLRVLLRLNEVESVKANASFDCLRETMQLYLQQTPKEGKSANWIIRNFEQIDGDVLRKNKNVANRTYHFACLSDRDMSITHKDEFPWPLDINFFEVAQSPVDWKYQVYVTSRLEYKNFRRYALVYGLTFSRCKIKLSYIKNERDIVSEPYYLLKILNSKTKPYINDITMSFNKNVDFIKITDRNIDLFSQYDLMRYRLCKYRFLLESVIEGDSVYKDEYLLKKYLTVVLENRARRHFAGKNFVKNIVFDFLNDEMDDLKSKFSFANHAEYIDVVKNTMAYLEKNVVNYERFKSMTEKDNDYMRKREVFLAAKLPETNDAMSNDIFKCSTQSEVNDALGGEKLQKEEYYTSINSLCQGCSEKDVCLELFRRKKSD